MPVMTMAVSMAIMLLILQLVLHRIRHRRTRRRAQQRLEFATLSHLVAQRTARAAAYNGSDEALFTVALLLGTVGGRCSTAAVVLSLAWGYVAAHVGVS